MGTYKKSDKLAELNATLAARRPAPTPVAPTANAAALLGQTVAGKLAPAAPRTDALVPNQSFSVFESDLDRLENIRTWLAARGLRNCNASEAVRLCVRAAAMEANADRLAELCRQGRAKDGRKTRWAQSK